MESNEQEKREGVRKRANKRFQPKVRTFIRVSSESEEDIGQLMDISKGGLSIFDFAL